MKKAILTIALVMAVGLVSFNAAEARWGGGWMMAGSGYGAGNCNGPGGWNQEKKLTYEEMERFHDETTDLRKQLFEKRTEYYNVMNQENPDKELAKTLWGEMYDLQNDMHKKALAEGMMGGDGRGGYGAYMMGR